MFFRKSGDFRNWLNASHFIIGMHNCNQDSFGTNSGSNFFHIHNAKFIHTNKGDFKTVFCQIITNFKNSWVFHCRSNDVVSFVFVGQRNALNGKVV